MLDLTLVLALAQACAPQVAPEKLAAIAWTESRFRPAAIGVNRSGPPVEQPRSVPEAIRTARALLARGANIDLGLAQINSDNLAWLGLSVEDAFDPCRNLAAASTVLRAGYRPDDHRTPQFALRVALSRYNTGHPQRGFRNGYVARVERAAVDLGLGTLRVRTSGSGTAGATVATASDPAVAVGPAGALNPGHAKDSAPASPPAWDVFAAASSKAAITFSAPETSQRISR